MADTDHRMARLESEITRLSLLLTRLEAIVLELSTASSARDKRQRDEIMGRIHMEQSLRDRGL
jgi:hypothetical protein